MMVYALWTRQAVEELILNRFGIKLAVRTMGLYLERWGFTPQKPMKKAYEQSPAAVKKWLDEDYPVIAACAKVDGAEIHWGDETGLRSDDVRGRSDAPQGQTPVIRVNNKRHALSVISTATNMGAMRWKAFDGALNSDILIDFVRRLVKDAGRKLDLILDNLRVHHSKPVKAWLAEHKHEIEVFYLPSYSPELNPNEITNADLKQAVTKLSPASPIQAATREGHSPDTSAACSDSPSGSRATSSMHRFGMRLEFNAPMPGQSCIPRMSRAGRRARCQRRPC